MTDEEELFRNFVECLEKDKYTVPHLVKVIQKVVHDVMLNGVKGYQPVLNTMLFAKNMGEYTEFITTLSATDDTVLYKQLKIDEYAKGIASAAEDFAVLWGKKREDGR